MIRKLARELKAAGFPIHVYQTGHKFYPNESNTFWTDTARQHGVTITNYELQNHLQDIKNGHYCPALPDLIEACGDRFGRLFVEKDIWTAESRTSQTRAIGHSPEEAVARLWLALRRA